LSPIKRKESLIGTSNIKQEKKKLLERKEKGKTSKEKRKKEGQEWWMRRKIQFDFECCADILT
jgi:hypothetical protein